MKFERTAVAPTRETIPACLAAVLFALDCGPPTQAPAPPTQAPAPTIPSLPDDLAELSPRQLIEVRRNFRRNPIDLMGLDQPGVQDLLMLSPTQRAAIGTIAEEARAGEAEDQRETEALRKEATLDLGRSREAMRRQQERKARVREQLRGILGRQLAMRYETFGRAVMEQVPRWISDVEGRGLLALSRSDLVRLLRLTPDQRERLGEALDRLQAELAPARADALPVALVDRGRDALAREGILAAGRPSVARWLGLDAEQRRQIGAILDEARPRLERLNSSMYSGGQDGEGERARQKLQASGELDRLRREAQAIRRESNERIGALLTPGQKAALGTLVAVESEAAIDAELERTRLALEAGQERVRSILRPDQVDDLAQLDPSSRQFRWEGYRVKDYWLALMKSGDQSSEASHVLPPIDPNSMGIARVD